MCMSESLIPSSEFRKIKIRKRYFYRKSALMTRDKILLVQIFDGELQA